MFIVKNSLWSEIGAGKKAQSNVLGAENVKHTGLVII